MDLEAMANGFLDELQNISVDRAKTAGALKDFGEGARAGAKGVIHAAKNAVKPGTPAAVRGIVAGGAAVPAAAGVTLGAGGMYAATRKSDGKEKKAYAEKMLPGTERYYSDRMRSILMGLAPRVFTPEGA